MDTIVGLVLILSPVEAPAWCFDGPFIREAVWRAGAAAELTGEYEDGSQGEYRDWLPVFRERMAESWDLPLLREADRFMADRDVAMELSLVAGKHVAHLDRLWHLDVQWRPQLSRCREEAVHCEGAWHLLWEAKAQGYSLWDRRESLAALRRLIGPHDYYLGRMPPPIPLHHLRILD